MKLRGFVAVVFICLGLLVSGLIQRFVIVPWVWLRPSRRHAVLGTWIQAIRWLVTRPVALIGGARLPIPPKIPCEPGILVLMNHQSLFDIPMIVEAVKPGYPRIVTRERYVRGIPLISRMVRLYHYPVVNPLAKAGDVRKSIKALREAARTSEVPIAVFPEGSRTKDGEIGEFRKGLAVILKSRPWKIHVLVADGFWKTAKLKHFIGGMTKIDGRVELAGVMEWPDPKADPMPFIDEIRELMVRRLDEMRKGVRGA